MTQECIQQLEAEIEHLEAQAAVMHKALEVLYASNGAMLIGLGETLGISMDDDDFPPQMKEAIEQARAALSTDAGRALLERLKQAERERDEAREILDRACRARYTDEV